MYGFFSLRAADAPTRQAIPYQASLLVSVISAFPSLSANIVGPLGVMAIKTTQQARRSKRAVVEAGSGDLTSEH
ncbi:hypothetical protein [Candidatus Thiodiazotropha sp. LNASS1]|uniref:hypothetical protein n=1 Tax=Candidatus Thiodiazotropha sp. LNASS1 TaxID=3096260 RepID=UPI0034DE34B3